MTVIRLRVPLGKGDERIYTGLAREGRTKLHLTVMEDTGVRRISMDRDLLKEAARIQLRGKPYPVARAVRIMRRVGRERGITEAAKRELEIASQDPT